MRTHSSNPAQERAPAVAATSNQGSDEQEYKPPAVVVAVAIPALVLHALAECL